MRWLNEEARNLHEQLVAKGDDTLAKCRERLDGAGKIDSPLFLHLSTNEARNRFILEARSEAYAFYERANWLAARYTMRDPIVVADDDRLRWHQDERRVARPKTDAANEHKPQVQLHKLAGNSA